MQLIAKFLTVIQITILCAAIGGATAFLGVFLLGMLTGSSNINGGLAMGAAGVLPFGSLVGAVAGVWLSWKVINRCSDTLIYATGYGLTAVCLLSIGGWFLQQELTDGDPYEPGKEPIVHIEWRLPDQVPHHHVDRIFRQMMRSSYMNWILSDGWDKPRARDENNRTILRMTVQIRWRVTGRIFQLWRAPAHNNRITVVLGLPRDPQVSANYGPWVEVKEHPGNAFRWRVERKK